MERLNTKLKKGDEVIVIAGKDAGKSGRIVGFIAASNRVLVEGVNQVKKHITARAAMARQGRDGGEPGIVTRDLPIAISNVMLKDPKTGKPTRVGYKVENGTKVRVAKASGAVLEGASKAGAANPAKAEKALAKTKAKSKK